MKQKLVLLITVLLLVLVVAGAYVLYNSQDVTGELGVVGDDTTAATDPTTAPTTVPTDPTTASTDPVTAATTVPPETQETVASIPAPDVYFFDFQGKQVQLSDFQGKPVILNFWASWCGPCKSEMPAIEAAYQTYGEDIHFIILNLTDGSRETVNTAKNYMSSQPYTFPVYFDSELNGAINFGVSGIPATFFIDAQGNVKGYYSGAMSSEILELGIDRIVE